MTGSGMLIAALVLAGLATMALAPLRAAETPPTIAALLEPTRAKYGVPAMGGAIFTSNGIVEMGVTGVRKAGTTVPATVDDLWHLGSDTKMMTALLAGSFVAEKKLAWDAKITPFFPDIAIPEANRDITLGQILSHHAGLIENLDWNALSASGSLTEQRLAAVRLALAKPAYAPGAFHYSNTDYVVAAAILEKISGKSWEDLIRERIFEPLGMKSAGFGPAGTEGQIDQPWPHLETGAPLPTNGPAADNPAIISPAGRVHASMTDWAKFLEDQLRGGGGRKALLPPEIYASMQTLQGDDHGDGYGYGWGVTNRTWAGGKALNHAGSNRFNFCVCWLALNRNFGVLVVTNQGGPKMVQATDDAASALILRYLKPGAKTP
jgi:CubicO group peptidase (beta-lactamase class C family)